MASLPSLISAPEFSISTLSLPETVGLSRKEAQRFFRAWLARILLPVRRIPRSFSCDERLARLELESYGGGTRKLLGEDADFAGCQGCPQSLARLLSARQPDDVWITGEQGFIILVGAPPIH
jgi:hypothetical protein